MRQILSTAQYREHSAAHVAGNSLGDFPPVETLDWYHFLAH
jgi:hypothetical protein